MAKRKTFNEDLIERVDGYLQAGSSIRQIREHARKNAWGADADAVDALVEECYRRLAESRIDLDAELVMQARRYNELYKRATEGGDLKLALDVLKCKENLLDLRNHGYEEPASE